MKHRLAITLAAGVVGVLPVMAVPSLAQTVSAPTAPIQSLQIQQPGALPALPGTGGAAAATSVVTLPLASAPTPTLPPATGIAPGTVGRGLPGMRGGPPLNGPSGAQDPSASYMRPPVIGPLECDLLVDPECL